MSKTRIRVHYNPSERVNTVMCGKQAAEVEWTTNANDVTCFNCRRSQRSQQRRAKANAPADTAPRDEMQQFGTPDEDH